VAQDGFAFRETESAWVAQGDIERDPVWDPGGIRPMGELTIHPAAAVFSYGVGVFEGLKVRRGAGGRVLAFRPADHAARFRNSAERLAMAVFPADRFVLAVEDLVRANAAAIPPAGAGDFYIRPMLHAIEPKLGHGACRLFRAVFFGCPVGSYFASEQGLRLRVVRRSRAAVGGTGSVKAIGNYAGGTVVSAEWRSRGFDDVLYLDARRLEFLTETSGANVFVRLMNGTIVTPPLDDQILPGITRDSAIRIARSMGLRIEERPLSLRETLEDGVEAFCTGTAWTVRSVAEMVAEEGARSFPSREVAEALLRRLQEIQTGAESDPFGWVRPIEGC
jgi:branched-chain amino acid aminotransferase